MRRGGENHASKSKSRFLRVAIRNTRYAIRKIPYPKSSIPCPKSRIFNPMPGQTAILFFTRSNTKQLGTTVRSSGLMHRSMQRHTAQLLAQSGLPVIRWDESRQVGTRFAERLSHALTSLFADGWQHLIVVGDDCPQLTLHDLHTAASALHSGSQVIGPDQDGGAYLIGLSAHHFNEAAFTGLPWQQNTLRQELHMWMSMASRPVILRPHADVDTYQQAVRLLLSALLPTALQRLWRQWVTLSSGHTIIYVPQVRYCLHLPDRRGPPVIS